jgi:hypothetical protein
MKLPDPAAGLVIRYSYLWRDEHLKGREEGVKDRPCAIIVALRQIDESDNVVVVPITHSPPDDPESAMEIPRAIKKQLGLDGERSWAILGESNTFRWPGPDLRPIGGVLDDTVYYGALPPAFFAELRRKFAILYRQHPSRRVVRTE